MACSCHLERLNACWFPSVHLIESATCSRLSIHPIGDIVPIGGRVSNLLEIRMRRRSSQQTHHDPFTGFLPGFEPEDLVEKTVVIESASFTKSSLIMKSVAIMAASHPTLQVDANTCSDDKAEESAHQAVTTPVIAEMEMPPAALPQTSQPQADSEQHLSGVQAQTLTVDYLSAPDSRPVLKAWADFDPNKFITPSGELERVKTNIEVLKLFKGLGEQNLDPTQEQREQMLRYTGWGSIARIFEECVKSQTLDQHRAELKVLLSEEEWASARASTPNAHYTDPAIVAAIWTMIQRFGFEGGRILEPAGGTGLFLAGMPKAIAQRSQITAIEIDKVSGKLLKQAFGPLGVDVQITGFEKASLPESYFDLVVTNSPFGEYGVADLRHKPYSTFSIHNYFAARSIDLVRPGGLVVMVTSAYCMDSKTTAHRKWIDSQAELVEAIRLPMGAFDRQAKTDVVTDILVLRKRFKPQFGAKSSWAEAPVKAPVELMAPGQQLTSSGTISGRYQTYDKERPINAYFAQHPQRVIGRLQFTRTQHGEKAFPVFDGGHEAMIAHLNDLAHSVRDDVYVAPALEQASPMIKAEDFMKLRPLCQMKPGSFVMHGGTLCISEGDQWVPVDSLYQGKARARICGLIELRDVAKEVIQFQSVSDDDKELGVLQAKLNLVYDKFVSSHGYLFDKMNQRAFRNDPDFPLILSLEVFDEETQRGSKAAIFSMRTVNVRRLPEKVDNVKDAMLVCLSATGRIVLSDMARRCGKTQKAVCDALVDERLAFKEPVTQEWIPADEYLSGLVFQKLEIARAAGPEYSSNVHALSAALPAPLGPGEIEVRLGAPWIPSGIVRDFIRDTMNLKGSDLDRIEVSYQAEGSVWSVKFGHYPTGLHQLHSSQWGTSDRNFYQLLEAALNQQPPTISRTVNGQSHIDRKATLAAREKWDNIKDRFKVWAFESAERTEQLVQQYNSIFNRVVIRRYDGSHLTLPGMSLVDTPYPHQLNAIWRILTDGNTLLAHVVGAGKSLTMIAAAMELKRLGKANKVLHVVPTHMLYQYAAEFVRRYPQANVLIASKDDLHGDKRREFVARVATGDWDSIVMTQSTFERLPMRPETVNRFIKELLDKTRWALENAQDSGAKRSIKELEKKLKTLETKLERAADSQRKDDMIYFEELGIDHLMADEAHNWKNLMRISKMPRIAGLPNTSSARAFDMLMKIAYLREIHGGRDEGVTMATATPIANSVAEAWTFMHYLIPNTLEEHGVSEFDAWAATFGEAVTGLEVAPDGSGYRMNTRFAKFSGVPELMNIFRRAADIQTRSMLNLPTPKVKGGKPGVIACKPSMELKSFTATLVERAAKLKHVDPKEDNMLKITHEGRLAALDMRLIDPSLPADPEGKVAMLVREVMRIREETQFERGAQLVFCDLSTPKSVGFSVYNQVRLDLMAAGMPGDEIAFIHDYDTDAQKAALFARVREGLVRVLLGSTQKMGVGTNVQKRLKAVHQIDSPYRPCDVEQRDGRGLRVGNSFEEIELLRYVTEGSFDTYLWQLLSSKAAFIDQLMSSDSSLRSIEDISMSSLTYSEIKAIASGNPMVLEKVSVDTEILKLSMLRDMWNQDRWSDNNRAENLKAKVLTLSREMPQLESDVENLLRNQQQGIKFIAAPGSFAEASHKGDSLESKIGYAIQTASRLSATMGDLRIGTIAGLELNIRRNFYGKYVEVVLPLSEISLKVGTDDLRVSEPYQSGKQVLSLISDPESIIATRKHSLERAESEIALIVESLKNTFPKQERLDALRMRQIEINAELDLDKSEVGSEGVTTDAETSAA
jgi:N12 class adenine-specific DNA methylase